jgi:hypothetical protein
MYQVKLKKKKIRDAPDTDLAGYLANRKTGFGNGYPAGFFLCVKLKFLLLKCE